MGIRQKLRTFQRDRKKWDNDEAKAFENVKNWSGLGERRLVAQHTEKAFVWKQIR